MDATALNFTNVPLSTLALLSLYVLAAIYAVFTGILYYHWNKYGTDTKVTSITLLTYLLTTIPLLLTMVGMYLLL